MSYAGGGVTAWKDFLLYLCMNKVRPLGDIYGSTEPGKKEGVGPYMKQGTQIIFTSEAYDCINNAF